MYIYKQLDFYMSLCPLNKRRREITFPVACCRSPRSTPDSVPPERPPLLGHTRVHSAS